MSVSSGTCFAARRRACTLSFLARVMSFSASGRSSFAFGRVVMMRSLSISDASWLRNIALRWLDVRPSLRFAYPCLIGSPLQLLAHVGARAGAHAAHAERETEALQDV